MRAYRVTANTPNVFAERYAGSEAEARKIRADLTEAHGLVRKNTEIEMIEIPTSKADLLHFLNKLMGA